MHDTLLGRPGRPLPFSMPSAIPVLERILFMHHYNMVSDPRLEGWVQAVEELPEGLVVAELGCGSGILSMVAARRAKRVYAVEIDDELIAFARGAARLNGLEDRIEFLHGDARTVELPEPVDAVFCEMLDTGMICEMQAEVMGRLASMLRPGGRIIPSRVATRVEPVWTAYEFHGLKLPLPFFQSSEVPESRGGFAAPEPCHEVVFDGRPVPLDVVAQVPFVIQREGVINSFRMTTDTEVRPGLVLPGSHWLNPPLVFPFEPVEVRPGDRPVLHVAYRMSAGLNSLRYHLELERLVG